MSLALMRLGAWSLLGWLGFLSLDGDLRTKKIRNVHILSGLAGVLFLYAALAAWGSALSWTWDRCALHAGICLAAAIFLWAMRVWPAGDAKFFFLLGAVFPLLDPFYPASPRDLFLILLINIFVPAALLTISRSLRKALRRTARAENLGRLAPALAERMSGAFPAAALVYLSFLFFWPRGRPYPAFAPWARFILPLAVSYALGGAARRLIRGAPWLAGSLLLGGTVWGLQSSGWPAARGLLALFSWTLALHLALLLAELDRFEKIPPEALTPYSRINEGVLRETLGRSFPKLYEKHFSVLYGDGLLPEQAKVLRRWCRHARVSSIEVARTVPFTPFIIAGVLLSLALRADCLSAAKYWLARLAG